MPSAPGGCLNGWVGAVFGLIAIGAALVDARLAEPVARRERLN
ncbi:MAG: hypothetical protein ACRDPW_00930 [Mycobacteriales bacterium]